MAHAGSEDLAAEHQGGQGGESAGAAALDDQTLSIHEPVFGQEQRRNAKILNVYNSPLPIQALSILAAITGGAAIVYIGDGKPPAGPELNGISERGGWRMQVRRDP
jgi:hypothetical protein